MATLLDLWILYKNGSVTINNYVIAGAGVEIAVADIVAGAGVEVVVADIAADDVAIAVPTLFNLADIPCCNNYNALG